MLFLLPPSETKSIGGEMPALAEIALPFNQLNETREQVLSALEKLCKRPKIATEILKLPKTQKGLLAVNLELRSSATRKALLRYTGTLYDAIGAQTLSARAWQRAGEQVLVQSALFGLISSNSAIPNYRFSATTNLPKVNLKQVWAKPHEAVFERLRASAPIIDLRSKSYAALAPITKDIEHYWAEVVSRDEDGLTKALNHFNKKAKGQLIRAVLESSVTVSSLKQLQEVASSIGFELLVEGDQLTLVV